MLAHFRTKLAVSARISNMTPKLAKDNPKMPNIARLTNRNQNFEVTILFFSLMMLSLGPSALLFRDGSVSITGKLSSRVLMESDLLDFPDFLEIVAYQGFWAEIKIAGLGSKVSLLNVWLCQIDLPDSQINSERSKIKSHPKAYIKVPKLLSRFVYEAAILHLVDEYIHTRKPTTINTMCPSGFQSQSKFTKKT